MRNKYGRLLTKKRILWLLGGVIVVVLLFCILFKERVAGTALSLVLSVRYTQTVKESYSTMDKELGSPLDALGFQVDLSTAGGCGYDDGFQVFRCSKMTRGETAVVDDAYIGSYSDEVRQLEQLVSQKGWTTTTSEGTTSSLEKLLSPEEDDPHMSGYYGVIKYEKYIDGFTCKLSISRFDHLFGVLSCSKVFKPF